MMRRLTDYIGFIVAGIIMIVAVLIYSAPHFGWRVDSVLSGSMEPELRVGSLVVIQPVYPADIEVGDIIMFRQTSIAEDPVTHRVIEIVRNSPLSFKTKGDANVRPDPFSVPASKVIGKMYFHISTLGYVTIFLQTVVGFVFCIIIPGITIIALYIFNVKQAIKEAKR